MDGHVTVIAQLVIVKMDLLSLIVQVCKNQNFPKLKNILKLKYRGFQHFVISEFVNLSGVP